jgi:hypothetical protein
MKVSEIQKIISRLKSAFTFNKFDDDDVTEEYQRFLAKYDFQQINSIINALVELDSQRVPPISVFIKSAKESISLSRLDVTNPEYCAICNNEGFILFTEKTDGGSYQYILHCICPVGKAQAYDGRNCKTNKSTYRVPCVTEYFDDFVIEQMKVSNLKKHKMTDTERQEIKEKLAKLGIRMPEPKPYEDDKGDAWEGDALCLS